MNNYTKFQNELLSVFNDGLFNEFDIMYEIKVMLDLVNDVNTYLNADIINRINNWLNAIKLYAFKNKIWSLLDFANTACILMLNRRLYDVEMLLVIMNEKR